MTRHSLKAFLLAALFVLVACSSTKYPPSEGVGSLSMALTASANGHSYRLRNAEFTISGTALPTPVVLTSEGDPDATLLPSPDLKVANDYSVNLADPGMGSTAWYLERQDPTGWVTVNATIATPNPRQNVQVKAGETTTVKVGFETDGMIVVLGEFGKVAIELEVTEKDAAASGDSAGAPDAPTSDAAADPEPLVDAGPLGPCEVSSVVAAHVASMATTGWGAVNRSRGMLMHGCAAATTAADCLATVPLADASNIGAHDARSAVNGQHLRVLYTSSNGSNYWTQISPDGRFVGRGTHVRDLARGVDVEASGAMYLPGFFPDNAFFMYQPGGRACPMNVLTIGTPSQFNVNALPCTGTSTDLLERLGVSLTTGEYWAAVAGSAANDNGGHAVTSSTPSPNSPWLAAAQFTLSVMTNTGPGLVSAASQSMTTPYQGDAILSPSTTLVMSRLADASGRIVIGYVLHRLDATRLGAVINAPITEVGHYCGRGGEPTISFDERFAVMHRYVEDDDAVELGFIAPSDPGFAAYRTRGASNIYLINLATGARTRLTNMAPNQYALYPAFRSDGWIYFLVRTPSTTTEHVIASDAALLP